MINTDLLQYEQDLKEVINLFDGGDDLRIRHRFTDKEDRFVNTITVNGNVSAYGNLIPKELTEIERKRLVKRYAKLSLYKALVKHFGVNHPWGALTGIRPTKLAYSFIEKGEDFYPIFTDTFKVSEEKANLLSNVINTQKPYYIKQNDDFDLFVFIPFCPSRCKYCSFICMDVKNSVKYIDEYVDVLIKDIRESVKLIKNLRSIYIGGGTPVSLSTSQLERILIEIDKINPGVEFTVEAGRPDVITKETLDLLKKYRVTRICINPQTFNDNTLELIGRNHTASDVINKYELAKNDFIINMDFICGLDGESFEDFKSSIDKAIELSPENITVHTLCIKRGSYLSTETKRLDKGEVAKMVDYAYNKLTENGYNPYYLYKQKYMAANLENVGYSKRGKECQYNVDTMEEICHIVACGANAISKVISFNEDRIERYASPKDVKTYIDKIDEILKQKNLLFSEKCR